MSVRYNPDRRSSRRLVLEWWVVLVTFAVSLLALGFAAGSALGWPAADSNAVIRSCLERHNSAKDERDRVSAYVLAAPPRVRVPGGTMPTRPYGNPALWACVARELP